MSDAHETQGRPQVDDDIIYPSALPFILVHVACFGAFWSGISQTALFLCALFYWLRIFAIGAGYHRYFSHRAYTTSRIFQFVIAFLAQSSSQKSVLWWAAKHRHHHLYSDTKEDVHSPACHGFFYSHVGWVFARRNDVADLVKVADLARYPELMWLHKHELIPPLALAVLCAAVAGWSGLIVGFFWSTVLVYHATFCINSLAHVHGRKRYLTGDDSRNNWLLALLTMGEGWHNNHHAYQSSVRQGFRWWEIDITYYLLKGLNAAGIIWDLKAPPVEVLRNEYRPGSRTLKRAAEQLARNFSSERIVVAITSTLHGAELSALQRTLAEARHRVAEVLMTLHLPQLPGRDDVMIQARMMFVPTKALDEIVDRAYELLLASIGIRLIAASNA
jgi:stearoyl-CoA desaturase (delta-9 desaturase)